MDRNLELLQGTGEVVLTGETEKALATVGYSLFSLKDGRVDKASHIRIENGNLDVGIPYTLRLEDGRPVEFRITKPGLDWSKGAETGNDILIQPLSSIFDRGDEEV